MHRFFTSLALLFIVFLIASPTKAALEVYEPFKYPLGTLNDGDGLSSTGTTSNWVIKDDGNNPSNSTIVAGLSYTNGVPLAVSDNALQRVSNLATRAMEAPINQLNTGTKWISFLIQNGGDTGSVPCGVVLNGTNSDSLFVGFRTGFSPTLTGLGLATIVTGTQARTGTTGDLGPASNIDNTTTHFIAVKIDFAAGADTVSLYVDPVIGDPSPVAFTTVNTFDTGSIFYLGFNGSSQPLTTFDELRVGDSYADVSPRGTGIPEPGSISIVTGILIAAGARQRAHRQNAADQTSRYPAASPRVR